MAETRGQGMEAGMKKKAMEECGLMACCHVSLSLLPCTDQGFLSNSGASDRLGHPPSIVNQESVSQGCLQANLEDRHSSSVDILSFQLSPVSMKLTNS